MEPGEITEFDDIDWNGNVSCIVNEDEKNFLQNNGDQMRHSLLVTHDIEPTDIPLDASLTSWGEYFGSASPAVSAIFKTGHSHVDVSDNHDHDDEQPSTIAVGTLHTQRKTSNTNSMSSDTSSVTTISIESLKHIHRFYQFKIQPKYHASTIEQIAKQYLSEFANKAGEHGQLLATTINEQTLQCTILVLFEVPSTRTSTADDCWMQHFLCYQPILEAMDSSVQPTFTQLSH